MTRTRWRLYLEGIQLATSLDAALESAELILILVRHHLFLELTPASLVEMTAARQVIDAVNAWSGNEWPEAGFEVHILGVGKIQPTPAIEL